MIFGKLIGAAVGYYIPGNVEGAVFGFLTGHAIDMLYADSAHGTKAAYKKAQAAHKPTNTKTKPSAPEAESKTQDDPWIVDLARLAAKVAKADGLVSANEIKAFKEAPLVKQADSKRIGLAFNEAKITARGVDTPALKIARALGPGSRETMTALDILVSVALADGGPNTNTTKTLDVIAQCLGHTSSQLTMLIERGRSEKFTRGQRRSRPGPNHPDQLAQDYALLDIPANVDEKSLKQAYRKLARSLHPDGMVAQGVSAEAIARAEEKLARVNAAYERILVARGWK